MDKHSNGSVISVDKQKWDDAQGFESSVWISGNRKNSYLHVIAKFYRALRKSPRYFFKLLQYRDFYAGDDWNFWWKEKFENYQSLPNHLPRALEVGCGPYTNLRLVSKLKKIDEMHCLDPLMDLYLSFKYTWLSVMAKKEKVLTYKRQGEDLGFVDNYFDLVICNNVLDHVENAETCLKEIYRVLKVGGYFVFGQDLSNQEDISKQRLEDRGFVGHPIKLDDKVLDSFLVNKYEIKLKKVLQRAEGRNPRHHYGTYLFIGIRE